MFLANPIFHRLCARVGNPKGVRLCAMAAALVLLLATHARAQGSQFHFDLNGNLFVQAAATTAPPQIIGQPQDRVVVPGDAATFFVVAADTRALTYEWRFNDVPLGGSATNDALLMQNIGATNEGEYRVVLTNPSGSVTSAPAMLWFDSDADGLADSWELTHFGSLTNSTTADFDGDGSANLQEFGDATDPVSTNSVRFHLTVLADGGSVIKTPDQFNYTNGESVMLTATASSNDTFRAWIGDIVSRSNTVNVVMTRNKTVFARFTPIVFTWTNVTSGDWDVAANWTPNLVPGSNDSVVIKSAASFTVTLNTPADCADVTLGSTTSGPTLTGSGPLKVRGAFSWTQGIMSGSGRIVLETGSTLILDNPNALTLTTRTLELGGETFSMGTGGLNLNNAAITNRAGAVFHALSANPIGPLGGVCRFDNAGTFRKSINTGTMTVAGGVSFNNSGTVEIQTGTLNLNGGGTNSGSIDVAAGTALGLSGTHNAGASSSITGAGQLTVSGGTATLAGTVNVSGSNTFTGGTANLIGNYICMNNTVTISGGAANFDGTGLVSPAVMNLSNGTLGGSNLVTVVNALNWTGGSMSGSGRTLIAPGATLNAIIPNVSAAFMTTRVLENGGTVLWTSAGNIFMNNAVITNRAGALFIAQNTSSLLNNGGSPRFDNAGTFRKSVSIGTTTVGVSFTNYGTVDIHSGILAANGIYASTSNALLSCAIAGTNAGTGYGQLQKSGTITLNGALSVDFINGFSPALNDAFTVLTAGSRNGTFANFSYPSNAVTMQLSNTANSVIARVMDVLTTIPQPTLLPPEISGTNFKLTWSAVSNATYRVEFNPNLTPSNWTALPGDVIGFSNTASKLDALTPSNRLYRIRVLP